VEGGLTRFTKVRRQHCQATNVLQVVTGRLNKSADMCLWILMNSIGCGLVTDAQVCFSGKFCRYVVRPLPPVSPSDEKCIVSTAHYSSYLLSRPAIGQWTSALKAGKRRQLSVNTSSSSVDNRMWATLHISIRQQAAIPSAFNGRNHRLAWQDS